MYEAWEKEGAVELLEMLRVQLKTSWPKETWQI